MKMITRTNSCSQSKNTDTSFCMPHNGFVSSSTTRWIICSSAWSFHLARSTFRHRPRMIFED